MPGEAHILATDGDSRPVAQTMLYLDPWAGLSGDMLLGALLDSDRHEGRLEQVLRDTLAGLGVDPSLLEISVVTKCGVSCTYVKVRDEANAPFRHLDDMARLIAGSGLSEWVRSRALEAVRRLASVEAEVHGCSVEEIHFHEVGALDTLVDVVGCFALVEALGVEKVIVGPIPVGGGTVQISHGRVGVPAPATALLLKGYSIVSGPEMRELTTPTGALLVGALHATTGPLPVMELLRIGHGAGSMDLGEVPNLLRALIGRSSNSADSNASVGNMDTVIELQTNLDDVTPEAVAHACRLLGDVGAVDVWTAPVYMKKQRPGVTLHVLVTPEHEAEAVEIVLRETGTLGMRRQPVRRWVAERGVVAVEVFSGEVRVKWGRWHGRLISLTPEYEDAAAVASAANAPLTDVMHTATAAALERLNRGHLLP